MKFSPIYIIFYLLSSIAIGQNLIKENQYIEAYQVAEQDSLISFESNKKISAVAIKSTTEHDYKILQGGGETVIPKDEDIESPTYFISLLKPSHQITLKVPSRSNFEVFLIASGDAPSIREQNFRKSQDNDCNEPPPSVPQSEWRSGLPEPNYSRSFHEIYHNVVHHAAGSNSNTNYTQVVRDIYLYHTQVNGWSDIGYNYLIAQDGTLFAGRDPDNGSQDNVRGAHFCGSNSGTLGVCLLGNYETATPTSESINMLEDFLTYQLIQQERTPFKTFNHPLGNLRTVVGHRDGCSTLCPGENVYNMLNEIRLNVEQKILNCEMTEQVPLAIKTDTTIVAVGQSITLHAEGSYDQFRWLLPQAYPFGVSGSSVEVSYSTPGFYDVTLVGIDGMERDTLSIEDYIQVSFMENDPVVFPNPAIVNEALSIDFTKEITKVVLRSIGGQIVKSWTRNLGEIEVPIVKSGIYLLSVQSENQFFDTKLIIQ